MFVSNPNFDVVLRGLILTTIGMVWVVALVRMVGLRSFSKMTNFDFVMTIATGSLLAGAAQTTNARDFAQTMVALATVFAVQWTTAKVRKKSDTFEGLIHNEPLILMRDGEFIEEALTRSRVARNDLIAKLREANVLHLDQVRAVVLETTGDISVLHGEQLQPALLRGTTSTRTS